ncbi:hypothetical protein EJ04DRAFT_572792 [Polyplosphaeria fusca]|uniref:Uncharacterized protein n=1 Tax=Polyplosphaeria fusca TaxID=682080 RepID=A0A9P4R9F4_9PLEO|nr:hypothetical protein EJ04DRAFT_572792 [Polyplosphaeria fusca]
MLPIKAPDKLLSDGKRMRVVWVPGDGDGDPSPALIERSLNILRGHPTWKLFLGTVHLPIIRGSNNEPPHYCYLDDEACHNILMSKAYAPDELHQFWPFDFASKGHIKQGRRNRGRPVWLDETCTEHVKVPMRIKSLTYTFSGQPAVTEYTPVRPKKETKMEAEVYLEAAQRVAEERLAKAMAAARGASLNENSHTDNTNAEASADEGEILAENASQEDDDSVLGSASAMTTRRKRPGRLSSLSDHSSEESAPSSPIEEPSTDSGYPAGPASYVNLSKPGTKKSKHYRQTNLGTNLRARPIAFVSGGLFDHSYRAPQHPGRLGTDPGSPVMPLSGFRKQDHPEISDHRPSERAKEGKKVKKSAKTFYSDSESDY